MALLQNTHSYLEMIDFKAWFYLHSQWRNPFLDKALPPLRNPLTWIPLYAFLAFFIPYKFGKAGVWWCFFFIACFAFGDFYSASILKPLFHRIRPCNLTELQPYLHLLVERSSGFSFPSSHATNHFAMGTFMAITLKNRYKNIGWLCYTWAALIAYAQVYVGVHFPLDVLAGGTFGVVIGIFLASVFHQRYRLLPKKVN